MMGPSVRRRRKVPRQSRGCSRALELRDQHAGGRRAIGHRRAGDAGQEHVADDRGLGEAAADMADQGAGEAEQALADAALVHQRAGQGEQRDRQQREGLQAGDHALGDEGERDTVQADHEAGGAPIIAIATGVPTRTRRRRPMRRRITRLPSATAPIRSGGPERLADARPETWRTMWMQDRAARPGGRHRPGGGDAHHRGLAVSHHHGLRRAEPDEGQERGQGHVTATAARGPGPARQPRPGATSMRDVHARPEAAGESRRRASRRRR